MVVAFAPLLPLPLPSLHSSPSAMLTRTASRAISSLFPSIPSISSSTPTTLLLSISTTTNSHHLPLLSFHHRHHQPFSSKTAYPLYYELVAHCPPRRSRRKSNPSPPSATPKDGDHGTAEIEDDDDGQSEETQMGNGSRTMDKAKRKYFKKMAKRMYGGSDSDDDWAARGEEPVELKPEVVEFPTLHRREEELYFYDMFAFPWEKDKHYKMVYQLEKKYFPDQCLDKAFVDAEPEVLGMVEEEKKGKNRSGGKKSEEKRDERGLVFFEKEGEEMGKKDSVSAAMDVSEKKVGDFFKCLKKFPSGGGGCSDQVGSVTGEPFLASRKTGLPPKWDGPSGTMVLVNKPKGWTSFTVCGKLRRLVKVQKVGHAGTLDPMATGLLIVGVGKATKLMDRYQGMIKGYSGIFRLGEATSTWDADSPVIQREPWEHIKDEDVRKAVTSFCGEIWQVPPMFSAIKVGGEKMYDKARKGEMVELSPRRISIFQFVVERSLDDRQNLMFRVTCSKGTYIRSLCADFGKALGSCAHLTALRRDSIGQYSADDAWDFQELQEQITKGYL